MSDFLDIDLLKAGGESEEIGDFDILEAALKVLGDSIDFVDLIDPVDQDCQEIKVR